MLRKTMPRKKKQAKNNVNFDKIDSKLQKRKQTKKPKYNKAHHWLDNDDDFDFDLEQE